jgi:hypothetical protein
MKKILAIVFLLFSLFTWAQRPFMPIKPGTEWFVEIHCFPEPGESDCNWTINCNRYFLSDEDTTFSYTVTLDGDTLLYEQPYTYNKLYTYRIDSTLRVCQYSGVCTNFTCQPRVVGYCSTAPQPGDAFDYIGALRQDTANKKIFYRPDCNFYKDTLLYDFSLSLGDTAFAANNYIYNLCENFGGLYNIVTNIDSVLLSDGLYHLRWWFGNTMKVIEGVGSDNGFLTSEGGICLSLYTKLVSMYNLVDTDTTYIDPTSCSYPNNCNQNIVDDILLLEAISPYKIFPNPANDAITIVNENKEHYQISLIDMAGQELLNRTSNAPLEAIDVQKLPNGVYLYRISRGKRMPIRGKLIVQH